MIDPASFTRALQPLLRRSAGYARSLLGGRADAEDAVQQAALQAWQRRAQFDPHYPFKAWWFAILRHHCLDQLRRSRRTPSAIAVDHVVVAVGPDEAALDRRSLETALARLPDAQREVLRLRYFAELSYQELALILDIPIGTVMSRLHLARKALAELVSAQEQP